LQQLAIVHTHAPDQIEKLLEVSREYFPDQNHFYRVDVTPVLGSHLGPGVFGFVAVTQ